MLPHLPTDRLRRRSGSGRTRPDSGGGDGPPLVTAATMRGASRLAAVDARAAALGLRSGMALADARAMHPGLAVAEADPAAEAALLGSIADWCRRWTPLCAAVPPDGVTLDIAGCAHLFGGEAALMAETVMALAGQGFAARAAIAPTPEAARALARFAPGTIVDEAGLEHVLRRLPVAALDPAPDIAERLARAGLRGLGDLALRPRAPLAARFGAGLMARLDAMLGRTRSPLSPRLEAPPYLAERRFQDPIATIPVVEMQIERLAREMERMLARHGEGARRLELALFRTDGAVRRLGVGTGRPVRDPAAVLRLFAERIASAGDDLDPGFGFDVVRLAVTEAEPMQEAAPRFGEEAHEADLAGLIDRLSTRLGRARVLRPQVLDAHWPDAAAGLVPAVTHQSAPARAGPAWNPTRRPGEPPDRPLRLLERPEPIEALAEVPDGPPLRFRWRRALHEVVAAEGPERIAPEWWRGGDSGWSRDYFRAEDADGRRFWLFREGLYGRETARPRWFLHGLFA
jgi:protein ImuB